MVGNLKSGSVTSTSLVEALPMLVGWLSGSGTNWMKLVPVTGRDRKLEIRENSMPVLLYWFDSQT